MKNIPYFWIVLVCLGCSLQNPDECTENQTKCGTDVLSNEILSYCRMGSWQQLSCGSQACNRQQGICEAAEYPKCSGDDSKCVETNGMAFELSCVNERWFPVMCKDGVCSGDKCQPLNVCKDGGAGHCMDLGEGIGVVEVSCLDQRWTVRYCDADEVCENRRCIVPVSEPEPFPAQPENDEITCGDHKDNDQDGKTDCDDEACAVLDMCQTDACPDDDNKTEPGLCGCGKADSDVDTDGDDTPDCIDACPEDYRKITAGTNGCGKLDKKGSDTDGTTFHIYTAEGILDYQALSESDRNKYSKLVFHGEINLDDAGKTVMGTEEVNIPGKPGQKETVTICSWTGWAPMEIPDGMMITGDGAKIVYHHKNIRCRIPTSLFGHMTGVHMRDLNFDLDGKGDFAGLLSDEVTDLIVDNIQYSGSMTATENTPNGFGLIGMAKGIQVSNVKLEIDSVYGSISVGGLVGFVEGGTIENKIIGLHNHINSIAGNQLRIGGVIGAVFSEIYMESVYNKVDDVYASHGFAAGLIGSGDSDEGKVTLKNIYNYVGYVDAYQGGGCLIGAMGSVKAENIVSYCKTRFIITSSYSGHGGLIGMIENGGTELKNIVNIHLGAKGGHIGNYYKTDDPPILNNIVSVARILSV